MHPDHPSQESVAVAVAASSSDFGAAYAGGALNDFFQLPPGSTQEALRLERPVRRQALAQALKAYAQSLGAHQAVLDNIERLQHPEARAVVTGQQVGLMLGPTFTLSKAVTAINLARRLDSPDRPVVPVFWLATQDHDVAEVDHAHVLDGSEVLHRVAVELPAGVPAGRIPVSAAMLTAVRSALTALEPRPAFLEQTLQLLEETATAGGYGDWFAALLNRLLGPHGLVIVNPLRPDFAELTSQVIRTEIEAPERSAGAINAAGARLKALGFEPQLGRGTHATNLFLETRHSGGLPQRVLLRHEGRSFYADGRQYSAADLLAMLDEDPTVITPAAGLRPVTQDAALPTAVFVLGPGELRYVAQLRGVYEEHGVSMPLAWPRASATVLEPAAARMLSSLRLSAAEFRGQHEPRLETLTLERSGHLDRFERAAATLESSFERLLAEVDGIDPTLRRSVQRGQRQLTATLGRLRSRSAQAVQERDATVRRQFDRLRQHLLPLGQPAERVLSPLSHALKFGIDPLVDRFLTLAPTGEQELVL